ncbi:unnamed protein product [Ilex paraguariensis]|uniref:RRM domain-containing protein n=1 Tax=Ilex paraguariensis TaxID=185542 RepID=A0ABC8USW2_9AQUA
MESKNGKLFVGGISEETNEKALKWHFSEYGKVKSCEVIKHRMTGQPRGFGFVTFEDPSVVDKVLQDRHAILGRLVEVKVARPKGERQQNCCCQSCFHLRQQENNGISGSTYYGGCNTHFKTKKIFVGGLPSNLTKEEFKRYFERFGTIEEVIMIYDKENNRPRGFGFITFDSEETVDIVLQMRYHGLNNKLVEVKRAKPKHRCINELRFGGWSTFGGFGDYSPYANCFSCCAACALRSGYYYGTGAYSSVYNGVGYETSSGMPHFYQNSPVSYGSLGSYPTYIDGGAYATYWDTQLLDMTHAFVSTYKCEPNGDDTCGDAELPDIASKAWGPGGLVSESIGAEEKKGVDNQSRPQKSSYETSVMPVPSNTLNENDDGGQVEVQTNTSLPCFDADNGSENNGANSLGLATLVDSQKDSGQ